MYMYSVVTVPIIVQYNDIFFIYQECLRLYHLTIACIYMFLVKVKVIIYVGKAFFFSGGCHLTSGRLVKYISHLLPTGLGLGKVQTSVSFAGEYLVFYDT